MNASAPNAKQSLGELVQTVLAQASLLIRQELRLAVAETKPKLARAGAAAGLLVAAAIIALAAMGALTATFILALALLVPAWLAALIVTAVYMVACACATVAGVAALKKAGTLVPTQTLQTLQEDVVAVRAGVAQAR